MPKNGGQHPLQRPGLDLPKAIQLQSIGHCIGVPSPSDSVGDGKGGSTGGILVYWYTGGNPQKRCLIRFVEVRFYREKTYI